MNPYETYMDTVYKLRDFYGLGMTKVHDSHYTFLIEDMPCFKLFYGSFSENSNQDIVISFHVEIDPATSVTWFSQVNSICPGLKLTDNFIETEDNKCYFGEEAESLRLHAIEQHVLSKWADPESKEAKSFVRQRPKSKKDPNKQRAFFDKDKALEEFDKLNGSDDDNSCH